MTHRTSRAHLLGFASVVALSCMAAPAFAQSAPQEDATTVDEIVVTGTRTVGRTRLDTIAPVDVISGEVLTRQGTGTELAAALAASAPSINFPRPAISDGSDHVRPATLRGLAPDQTLVLINGQRGHISALVNVNGSLGRGAAAFDLNTIPSVTLGSVEVLRDGASAQYGSDAIAGVVNLRLREANSGGNITLNYGRYETEFDTARGSRDASDGEQVSVAGWIGLPFYDDGFLTISGELQRRDPTNRSDYATPAATPTGSTTTVLGRFGDPEVESRALWFNLGNPLDAGWEVYAFGGVVDKDSSSAATARAFNNATGNVLSVYPNGFLPLIETHINDYNLYGGFRGPAWGIDWDISASWGRNALDYRVENSINASFGAASLRSFRAGGLVYEQATFAVDGVRPLDIGLAEPVNLAFGVEYRNEDFQQTAGQQASYVRAPGSSATGGSQGFPGFSPANATQRDRNNIGAYVDIEGNLTEALTFGVAARYENYSDFGDTLTGKVSARYDFSPAFALRGAVSTGFRAPALQQQYFSYIATNLVTTVVGGLPVTNLIQSGTFRVDDPVSIALGARDLEPEESVNYSIGAVFRSGPFELTIDAYQIEIEDRIILSENLGPTRPSQSAATIAAVLGIIQPLGVSSARFFTNGLETTTQGIDIVGRYRFDTDTAGRFDLTLAGNFNDTSVDSVPGVPVVSIPVSPNFLFDRSNILAFEEGTPSSKIVGSVDWSLGDFSATARATYYDSVLIANNASALDYETGDDTLVDVEGRYEFPIGVTAAFGVNNLFDEYPNFTPANLNPPTGSVGFPQFSPYGFNGRFVYGRLSYSF